MVATHPAPTSGKSRVGVTRDGVVYELFYTALSQNAFTASDVVALYLHRGAFETALADEDLEQDPDRWCSHTANGQEAWQIVSQWVWNLRLELGHQLHPDPARTTEFAPALAPVLPYTAPPSGYASAQVGLPWKAGRFSGQDFVLQPDGTLHCPAGQLLIAHERRRERDGSLRVVYAASIRSCRPCPLREQWRVRWAVRLRSRARSACSCIPSSWVAHPCFGVIGVAGVIDGPASNCCVPNGWRCWQIRACLRSRTSCLHLSRVHSVHITGSTLLSGCFAMPAPQPRAR